MGEGLRVAGAPGRSAGGLEGFFRLREHGTDTQTEVLAGITTFVVMSYIIAVNPAVLSAAGLDVRAVATSTCLVSGLLTLAMGLYTNRAFAIAPGLGLNAIVAYSLVGTMGLTAAEAMGVVVAEGVLITILVLLGVRKYVMDVVPIALSRAISVGIGFFILFIGLRNAGLITFIPGQTGTVDGLLTLVTVEHMVDLRRHCGSGRDHHPHGPRVPCRHSGRNRDCDFHRFPRAWQRHEHAGGTDGGTRFFSDRSVQFRFFRQARHPHRGAGHHQLHAVRLLRHDGNA